MGDHDAGVLVAHESLRGEDMAPPLVPEADRRPRAAPLRRGPLAPLELERVAKPARRQRRYGKQAPCDGRSWAAGTLHAGIGATSTASSRSTESSVTQKPMA